MPTLHHQMFHIKFSLVLRCFRMTRLYMYSNLVVPRGGRTRSKCHMTSITLFTCHSAITPGGAWLGTVLVQLVHSTAGVWWEKHGTFDSQEQ